MSTIQHSKVLADDVIRSFLLGRLEAAEQERFEAQLMTDDRLHERVRRAEFQLADDLVAERIDRIDRQRVLKTFVVTADRRRMVSVSHALSRRFSRAREGSLTTGFTRSIFNQPVLRLAFGVLVFLLLIGSVWLVTKEPQLVKRLIPKRVRPRPAATAMPQEANHPSNTAPPVHREASSSPPEHESSPPSQASDTHVVTTLTLLPGALTDLAQTPAITQPESEAGVVRLELTIERDLSGEHQAELLTSENPVLVWNSTKASGNRVNVDIPARVLKAGDYEVRLSRLQDGSKQMIASYYFRIK